MILDSLIKQLTALFEKGFGKQEVNLLCCDDNPIKGDGIPIKGVYVIINHPDKNVDGVYIDGTCG